MILRKLAALILILSAACAFAQTPAERTRQALDLVLARKYQAFYDLFSANMKKAVSLETYSQQADKIVAMGAPKSIDAPTVRMVQGSLLVTIPIHWPTVTLNFLVSWDHEGKIQGTFFRPGTPESSAWTPPDYSKAGAFTERDVTIGNDVWKLPGTLTLPKGTGPFPAVVLVHGSGPHDRDETVGGTKPFKDLAQGLASRGIAVLRYVKRTQQYPVPEAAPTMTAETVEDAVRAAELLRHQPEIDSKRIYVLGHSQGGYMMPRIMQRDAKLAGVIVMAGNVRPLEELIVEQTEYILSRAGGGTPGQRSYLEKLKKDPWSVMPNLPRTYREDLKDYHPAEEAKKIDMPMLILQGERDYQVSMKDFALWRAALDKRANVVYHSYPKLNHLFVAGEGKSEPAEYERPGHVSAEVIQDIAVWIEKKMI
jgi:dipeptidyl aminopeptidase/acylaminoacyl peptidase